MRFESNKLLVSRSSWQRYDELAGLFKNNHQLELASYKMKRPGISETAKWRRPLKTFDEYIKVGMLYDEVLYLMGSPDSFVRDGKKMQWSFETSPVGGFRIHFVDGKVVRKGFSFDRPTP